ncbi:MAG: dolichyl-phosphooligosaccharide-protein glycotransferase, partial [Methanolobus sp.]|nr:dolichyl-phosphooligosaccharide-protein glycotransferase [Methanolobus sp.]
MSSLLEKSKNSIPVVLAITLFFLIAYYIRTIPEASVFLSNGFVRFGGNDPWYHLRNVENILSNFPHMLWYDAYTNYPYGTDQVFAPLFDMSLATLIWILGLGNPSQGLINTVSAYYPAILGALVVVPTYFAGKWVFGRKAGLLAAFLIAIAPGQFLSRSLIGFNDHHIIETLLTTFIAMFLIIALKKTEKYPFTLKQLKGSDFSNFKNVAPYFILTGIALSAYMTAWTGGVFFAFIIGVYVAVQHIVDHMHGRSPEYLSIGTEIIFAIALVVVLITPQLGGYGKSLPTIGLITGLVAFPVLTGISLYFRERKYKRFYYPLTIAGLFIVTIILAKIISPSAYSLVTRISSFFTTSGGALTIAEASPLLSSGGQFSLQPLWYNFGTLGYISFFALAILIYKAFTQKNTPDKSFLMVWTLMIIWAMLQQNRFAYYYSVNAAILSAWIGIEILNIAGWKDIASSIRSKTFNAKNIKAMHILSAIFIILIMVYPSYSLAMQQSQGTGGPNGYWIEATQWLRYDTPDPGLDYYENYQKPATGESYNYPDTAYGVMSWWDYGHWIEVIGRRIPNANPFQQGVGGRRNSLEEENQPGASTFFTASSEEEATAVLEAINPDPNKAGARYIVSDVEMATGKFYAMAAWTLDTADYYVQVQTTNSEYVTVPGKRYFNSMEARLHIFDGNGLKQYRMVHESPSASTQETGYKNVYNVLFGGNLAEENTGYVKIFEYVKGATITGTAPANETVTITNTIQTNQ